MATCKMTKSQQATFEKLIGAFSNARSELESFLEEIKGEWESDLDDKSESYQESQAGQDARERLSTLESWIDEISTDFDPDLSEIS